MSPVKADVIVMKAFTPKTHRTVPTFFCQKAYTKWSTQTPVVEKSALKL